MKLNDFFSNAVINLKIPKFENLDTFSENIDHRTLKAIVKDRKYPILQEFQNFPKNAYLLRRYNTIKTCR